MRPSTVALLPSMCFPKTSPPQQRADPKNRYCPWVQVEGSYKFLSSQMMSPLLRDTFSLPFKQTMRGFWGFGLCSSCSLFRAHHLSTARPSIFFLSHILVDRLPKAYRIHVNCYCLKPNTLGIPLPLFNGFLVLAAFPKTPHPLSIRRRHRDICRFEYSH